jgi:hypothetical protein
VAESVVLPPNQPPEAKVSSQPAGRLVTAPAETRLQNTSPPAPSHAFGIAVSACRVGTVPELQLTAICKHILRLEKKINLVLI